MTYERGDRVVCDFCGQAFHSENSKEQALEESRKTFPGEEAEEDRQNGDVYVLCTPCYTRVMRIVEKAEAHG